MDKSSNKELVFEDISSSSPKSALEKTKEVAQNVGRVAKKTADSYGNNAFKNIDKSIKLIAFIVAIAVFLVFLAGAVLIYFLDKALIFVSIIALVLGAAISLMCLFLIYGLGHSITQNKHIISQNRAILRELEK